MTESHYLMLGLALLSVFALLVVSRRRANGPLASRDPHPAGFSPRVLGAEVALAVTDLVRLSVRIDEVWESPSGMLVPVETKTHDRVYPSDRIQISACGYVLRKSERFRNAAGVSPYGIVRLCPPQGDEQLVRVPLLSDVEVENLLARYVGLKFGLFAPSPEPSPLKCGSCGFSRRRCEHAQS